MHFQIDKHAEDPAPISTARRNVFTWRLVGAVGTLARSPEAYDSEPIARSTIAAFKRSASGVRYATVKGPQDG